MKKCTTWHLAKIYSKTICYQHCQNIGRDCMEYIAILIRLGVQLRHVEILCCLQPNLSRWWLCIEYLVVILLRSVSRVVRTAATRASMLRCWKWRKRSSHSVSNWSRSSRKVEKEREGIQRWAGSSKQSHTHTYKYMLPRIHNLTLEATHTSHSSNRVYTWNRVGKLYQLRLWTCWVTVWYCYDCI